MNATEQAGPASAQTNAARNKFFRQSGWMMFATLASGIFMFAVHFFSDKLGGEEYGIFGTLLAMLSCLAIPAIGLQMSFARQTAAAVTEQQQRRLAATLRTVAIWLLVIWLALALGLFLWASQIGEALQISPTALWVTIALTAITMSKPVTFGLLQGRQDFLWMGWAFMLSGVGRFLLVALFVVALGGGAASVMVAALLGELLALVIGVARTWDVWTGPGGPVEWRPWLRKMVPVTLGFAAFQFIYSADPMFVRSFLDKGQTGGYVAAGILCRALVLFTAQIAAVMFPKIVRSVATAQKTDMFKVTLLSTAVLAGFGAVFISYVLPIGLRLFFKGAFVQCIPLLPPFAASMAILTLANVMINNLMAREQFRVVPWLVLIAVAYGLSVILKFHESTLEIVYTLGAFSILLALTCLIFTWKEGNSSTPALGQGSIS